ncbi:adenosine deaminase [Blastococcus sp. VKM Ac-2987]|uniref:adenosine deaminase n=1 Tax=Blastococcus sp. VKM Ac-2987 TaxID=3004141 RepID=UPI0022ABBA7A|nr:adenosine deaminase [Blastococcus sp. VKM Ac-2987]MCZ2860760.1 adenosine deaminase [Blastococcus sp. VKM Ac-2987]
MTAPTGRLPGHPPRSRPVPTDPAVDALVAALPKVSLHCHLIGAVSPQTVVELAAKHGVRPERGAADLYDHDSYEDLGEFLRVLDVVGSVIRDVEDFHRVTYESLTAGGADHNVVYREIQLSPPGHPGVPYPRILEGVVAGLRDARADTGIEARLVIGINRERSGAEAVELVEQVVEHRIDEVVGIGLDYAEVNGPPGRFVEAYQLAGRAGLGRTAHSESGPPGHIRTLLDELGCSRVDHGYHVVDDPELTARCVAEGVPFNCTPVSSDIGRYSGSGDGTHARIRQMVDAGLRVTIDSDDPPMFGTDPTHDLRVLAHALGYRRDELASFTWNAIDACWLDETGKASLRARAEAMVAATPDAPPPPPSDPTEETPR